MTRLNLLKQKPKLLWELASTIEGFLARKKDWLLESKWRCLILGTLEKNLAQAWKTIQLTLSKKLSSILTVPEHLLRNKNISISSICIRSSSLIYCNKSVKLRIKLIANCNAFLQKKHKSRNKLSAWLCTTHVWCASCECICRCVMQVWYIIILRYLQNHL